ncbi:head completion protein [bacterium]|nr:head completion protein [bacterium]
MLPLKRDSKYRQGFFKPKNANKYIGKSMPVYRSGWELRFFRWCDDNPNILEWASESVIIPYINKADGKTHRYYTDGIVAIKENDKIVKYIIEIKPSSQTKTPVSGNKRRSTLNYENYRYLQNISKWEAAKKWCEQRGYKFLILTEKELGLGKRS